jgi:hypothetical protein
MNSIMSKEKRGSYEKSKPLSVKKPLKKFGVSGKVTIPVVVIGFFISSFLIVFVETGVVDATTNTFVDTYSTTGTWIDPTDVSTINVEAWGGGGSGGNGSTVNNTAGGGGSGGAYAQKTAFSVSVGSSYTVTVGVAQATNGTAGNPTWFGANDYPTCTGVVANGGAPGTNQTAAGNGAGGTANSATSCGDSGKVYKGGNGATGNNVSGSGGGGGGGAGAGNIANGASATTKTGATGANGGGNGGTGVNNAAGGNGVAPGGGGGGGSRVRTTNRAGGQGAAGKVIVTYSYTVPPTAPTFVGVGAQTSGTGSTLTPVLPAGVSQNDLMLLIITDKNSATNVYSIPGWTLRSSSQNTIDVQLWYKIAGASETNPTVTLSSGSCASYCTAQIADYAGNDTYQPFDLSISDTGTGASGTTLSPTATSTLNANVMAIDIVAENAAGSIATTSSHEAGFIGRMWGSGYSGNVQALALADRPIASSESIVMPQWTAGTAATWAYINDAIAPLTHTITLGNGTDPGNSTVGPGASATEIDRFSLVVSAGSTDTVSGLTVTLGPTNAYQNIGTVSVETTGGTTLCSATPTSNVVDLTSCGITVTTSSTEYKVMITPLSATAMPAPPGASYATTATVTSVTAGYLVSGSDTGSGTITVDNLSPSDVTGATATAGNAQVSLSWTNSALDSDLADIMVLASTSAITFVPTEGTASSTSTLSGASRVACYGLQTSCTDTSVVNGTTYYYKIYSVDSYGNWSTPGATPTGSPATPTAPAVTTLGNGTDPGNSVIGPGASATEIDRFSLSTNTGTDSVTGMTVTLGPANAYQNIGTVDVQTTANVPTAVQSQTNSTGASAGASIAITFSSAVTSGNTVVGGVSWGTANNDLTSVTDDKGNTYNIVRTVSDSGNGQTQATFYLANITNAPTVITANFTNTPAYRAITATELSGVATTPLDGQTGQLQSAPGTGTDAITSLTITPTQNGDYIYGVTFDTSTHNIPSAGTNFTSLASVGDGATTQSGLSEGLVQGTAASIAATFTGANDNYASFVLAFKSSGTGGGVSKCSATPSSNTVVLTTCGISVTTASTEYKVMITPLSATAMPAPPGASYDTTATVTSITAGNSTTGSDSGSATITVDNLSPGNVTGATAVAGDGQASLAWTNPSDTDLNNIMVLASTSAITFAPVEGNTYSTSTLNGASRVACYGLQTSCTDTSVVNGTTYYYKIYAVDTHGNWSTPGVTPSGSPVTPAAPAVTLTHFRWRTDNGTEVSATYPLGQDVSATQYLFLGDRVRLRFLVSNTGSVATGYTYTLEQSSSTCTSWIPVPSYTLTSMAGNTHWIMDLSGNVADGTQTTDQSALTDPVGGSFVAGYVETLNNTTPALTLSTNQFTELEYSIRSTGFATIGTNYCFRLTNNGSTSNFTYSVQPQAVLTNIIYRPSGGGQSIGGEGNGSGPIINGGGVRDAVISPEGSGSGPIINGGGPGGGGGDSGFLFQLAPLFASSQNFYLTRNPFLSFIDLLHI